jgi:hypothetical protein
MPTKSKEQHLAEYNVICEKNLPLIAEIDRQRIPLKKAQRELYKKRVALSQEIRVKERYCKVVGAL